MCGCSLLTADWNDSCILCQFPHRRKAQIQQAIFFNMATIFNFRLSPMISWSRVVRNGEKTNKWSLFQVVSRRVGGVREGRCEKDWGPDLGKAQARCDVAFGCWASRRSDCQNDGLSAALEPGDATRRRQKQTEAVAGWSLSEPHSRLWFSVSHQRRKCNTPAERVPSCESVRWCEKGCIFTSLHRLEP